MVFWARPPEHVIRLSAKLQDMLKEVAPSKYFLVELFKRLRILMRGCRYLAYAHA